MTKQFSMYLGHVFIYCVKLFFSTRIKRYFFSCFHIFINYKAYPNPVLIYIYYYFVSFWINICFLNENGLIIFRKVEIKKWLVNQCQLFRGFLKVKLILLHLAINVVSWYFKEMLWNKPILLWERYLFHFLSLLPTMRVKRV